MLPQKLHDGLEIWNNAGCRGKAYIYSGVRRNFHGGGIHSVAFVDTICIFFYTHSP